MIKTSRASVVVLSLAGLALSACGDDSPDSTTTKPQPTRFEQAFTDCEGKASNGAYNEVPGVRVEDDGRTLIMDTQGEGFEGLACMTVQLDTPDSIVSRIDNTSAMMGELEDEADGITYRWTYHPDNGLHMVMTDADA